MTNILQEYLVSLGFTINNPTFNQFQQTMRTADRVVNTASSSMARAMVSATGTMVSAIAGVTIATGGMLAKLEDADMSYKKFGLRMFMANNHAKDLKVTLDALGESIEDAAFIPELRGQFQSLLAQGRGMAPPKDYAEMIKNVREIVFEFKRLKLEIHYASEWIGYYLGKHLAQPIASFKEMLRSINDYLTKNMSVWTEKVASVLASVINIGRSLLWLFTRELPGGLKLFEVALLAFGVKLLLSPIGMFLATLTAALILLEDYYGYTQGWKSSETLKPMWEWMDKLTDDTKKSNAFTQLNLSIKEFRESVEGLLKSIKELWAELKFDFSGNDFVTAWIRNVLDYWKQLVDVMAFGGKLLMHIIRGDWEKFLSELAARKLRNIQKDFSGGGFGGRDPLHDQQGPHNGGRSNPSSGGGTKAPSEGPAGNDVWRRMAQKVSAKTGIPAALIYAQWSHETGGFSHLAAPNNVAGLTQSEPNGYPQPDGANYYIAFSSPDAFADKYAWWIDEPQFKGVDTAEGFSSALRSIKYYTDDPAKYTAGIKRHLGAYSGGTTAGSNGEYSMAPSSGSVGGNTITQINQIDVTVPPGSDAATYGAAIAKAMEPYGVVQIRMVHQMREIQGVMV